jgi:hypothetical protein
LTSETQPESRMQRRTQLKRIVMAVKSIKSALVPPLIFY